ncbi:hypothetical protein BCEP4_540038 [Burkholderia cepacia]|nr:hypothetical protein BCEP4_540038 [Burkholderia cepacia]
MTNEQPSRDYPFWRVHDSLGRDHGTHDRPTAAAVLDRVWKADPMLEWVSMEAVPFAGALH